MAKNELQALNDAQIAQVNSFFGDMDFSGMNKAIEKLAEGEKLDSEGKTTAAELIASWETDVVNKLRTTISDIDGLIYAIEKDASQILRMAHPNGSSDKDDTCPIELRMLAQASDTEDMLSQIISLMEANFKASLQDKKNHKLSYELHKRDMTPSERIQEEYRLRAEDMKLHDKMAKNSMRATDIAMEMCYKIMQCPVTAAMLKQLKKRRREMSKMTDVCHDKAQIAKCNINIDDEKKREALKELISITKSR